MSITARAEPPATIVSTKFTINSADKSSTSKQYFRLYHDRLQKLRPILIERARDVWGNVRVLRKVLDSREVNLATYGSTDNVPQECFTVIIGTMYKEMVAKPSALDEYRDDRALIEAKQQEERERKNFTEDTDSLLCEDEYGNVTAQPLPNATHVLDVHRCISGAVMALCGFLHNGIFLVYDFVLPDFVSYCPRMIPGPIQHKLDQTFGNQYIAFISDLQLGRSSLAADVLLDFLGGFLGDPNMTVSQVSRISRVIFCGNVFPHESDGNDPVNLKHLDGFMSMLASSVDVDVIPGMSDPTNAMVPQQSFHRCLFPKASRFNTFHCTSNPYSVELTHPKQAEERYMRLTGTSGNIVQNMMMFSRLTPLECLELSLRTHIIAPNAPDTISCFPFKEQTSPLLIEVDDVPRVYFTGCPYVYHGEAEEGEAVFETNLIRAETRSGEFPVRLLVLPSFHATGQIVLMKMDDLSCEVVQICVPE